MQLRDYIRQHAVNITAFAKEIGVARNTVYSWIDEQKPKIPGEEAMKDIYAATSGAVTANDFYGITPHEDAHG